MLKRIWMATALAAVALAAVSVGCGGDDDDKGTASSGGSTGGDAAALLAKVPAPGEAPPAGSKVLVGREKDNKTSVGLLVLSDGAAVAYECDGDQTWTWYTGSVSGSNANLSSADGKKLTATISGSNATGKGTNEFTLQSAGADRSGLFRVAGTEKDRTVTGGWIVQTDGTSLGGLSLVNKGTTTRIGGAFDPKRVADIEALPEFPEIKQAIPGFPSIPADLTVFSVRGNLCGRIAGKLVETTTVSSTPDTFGNRTRLGLLERLGCQQRALFADIV